MGINAFTLYSLLHKIECGRAHSLIRLSLAPP
jgi:hypothetical protein